MTRPATPPLRPARAPALALASRPRRGSEDSGGASDAVDALVPVCSAAAPDAHSAAATHAHAHTRMAVARHCPLRCVLASIGKAR